MEDLLEAESLGYRWAICSWGRGEGIDIFFFVNWGLANDAEKMAEAKGFNVKNLKSGHIHISMQEYPAFKAAWAETVAAAMRSEETN